MTIYGQSILRQLTSVIQISAPAVPGVSPAMRTGVTAIWDTGATHSAISNRIVNDLGITAINMRDVRVADRVVRRLVYLVDFHLPLMSKSVFGLDVTECDLGQDADALIGMDVITRGDFVITNEGGKTTMSFRMPSLSRIDYVKETNFRRSKSSQPPGIGIIARGRKPKKRTK